MQNSGNKIKSQDFSTVQDMDSDFIVSEGNKSPKPFHKHGPRRHDGRIQNSGTGKIGMES